MFSTSKRAVAGVLIIGALVAALNGILSKLDNSLKQKEDELKRNPGLYSLVVALNDSIPKVNHHLVEAEAYFHVDNLKDARAELDKAKRILNKDITDQRLNQLVKNGIITPKQKDEVSLLMSRINNLYNDIIRRGAEKRIYKK